MRPLAIAVSLFLTACAFGTIRYGSGEDVQQFRALEPGKATKADVLVLAGPPLTKSSGSDGAEVWTYSWSDVKSTGFVVPFYYSVDTTSHVTVAALFFRGEVLERIEWHEMNR